LVVNKPSGMLSQGDLTGDLDVITLAKDIIKRRDNKPGSVYLGLVHRLDRPVGGTMVLAKTSKAAARLSGQFRERQTKKIYRAVIEGELDKEEGTLNHYLLKDRARRITRVVSKDKSNKEAKLDYRIIESRNGRSLVEVNLITGLSHQIRVQFSHIGHPVLNDHKYGTTPAQRGQNIALYAKSIGFFHPTKKEWVEVTTNPPKNWPWH